MTYLGLLAVAALVVATGFFVAAEFGLVAARRAAIEERAARGSRRARAALHEMSNLSFMLSGAQLGITITTLVLGYIAEPALAHLLRPVIHLFNLSESTTLGISLAAALVISTILSMIVGELAPKNLAVARPEATALAVAVPMRVYSIAFRPAIWLFDSAAAVLSRLVGIEPREELFGGYTPDELARIIEASTEEGSLSEEKAQLLLRAVELGERRVSEIMVPRPDIVWLGADDPVDVLRHTARTTGYSRFPVRGEDDDDVVGSVHIKDLLKLSSEQAESATVADIAHEALVVPESHTLRRLLADLRARQRTFAVVVDEFGGTAGMVTLEDVLEALVGDIVDEFDPETPALRRLGVGRYVIPGRMRTGRVEEVLGTELAGGDYETVAGFVIDALGHIPRPGEWVRHDGWRFIVLGLDGNRVTEVLLEREDEDAPPSAAPGTVTPQERQDERSEQT
ncbi:MAG: hemolysin family protein [Actinomycetota bacterium]|nr:hemolysin family protein [Actinomycetota bacterium]